MQDLRAGRQLDHVNLLPPDQPHLPAAARQWPHWLAALHGSPLHGRTPSERHIGTLLFAMVMLLGAIIVDYLAPWPFIMTPLYAVPVLIAVHRLQPRGVGAIVVLVTLVNFVSGMVQGTPLEVILLYSSGLVMTGYLAILLTFQRQKSAVHAREAELHAQAAELAQRHLQEFMGMITHDLRNPLTTMLGYIQILHKDATDITPERQRRAISSIEAAAHQVDRLVADLSDAGAIGAGHFAIQTARIDLLEVVRRVIDNQATTTNHYLILDTPERLEGEWDVQRMSQLLTNLISNAIKYSPAGGQVRVAIQQTAGEVIISISDQGIGLSRTQIDRLFQPFTRLYSGQDIRGTGLGLYICKAIVAAHGGRIWVVSEPGQGSTFFVALPQMAEVAQRLT
jgi:signal transduction histidine kinase